MMAAVRWFIDRICGKEEKSRRSQREAEADRIAKGMHEAANRVHFLEISADLMRRKQDQNWSAASMRRRQTDHPANQKEPQ